MSEEKISELEQVDPASLTFTNPPQCECPIHGMQDGWGVMVRGKDYDHRYCTDCFDQMLQKHCQMVKEMA